VCAGKIRKHADHHAVGAVSDLLLEVNLADRDGFFVLGELRERSALPPLALAPQLDALNLAGGFAPKALWQRDEGRYQTFSTKRLRCRRGEPHDGEYGKAAP
jgi:hypothetical protein